MDPIYYRGKRVVIPWNLEKFPDFPRIDEFDTHDTFHGKVLDYWREKRHEKNQWERQYYIEKKEQDKFTEKVYKVTRDIYFDLSVAHSASIYICIDNTIPSPLPLKLIPAKRFQPHL